MPFRRVEDEDAIQFRLHSRGLEDDDIARRLLDEAVHVRSEDPAFAPAALPAEDQQVCIALPDVVDDRVEDLVAHLDPRGRVRAEFLRMPPQLPELPSHLAHVGSVDRVDGKRRRDLDYMEKSELRVLDLGHHGAEVDELHPIEVRDRKEDVVPAAVDRQNRLHDLRDTNDDLLVLMEIVHQEANPDPAERDDPGNRFDGPKAEGDHELRRDAEHRDDREQRHHIIPFHVGHRLAQDDRGVIHHEEQEEEHDVRARGDRVDVQRERDEDDDEAGDRDRNVGRSLACVEPAEDARQAAVPAHGEGDTARREDEGVQGRQGS